MARCGAFNGIGRAEGEREREKGARGIRESENSPTWHPMWHLGASSCRGTQLINKRCCERERESVPLNVIFISV